MLKNMFNIYSDMIYTETDRNTEAHRNLVSPHRKQNWKLGVHMFSSSFFALLCNAWTLVSIIAVNY
jgi:hypothetical protein